MSRFFCMLLNFLVSLCLLMPFDAISETKEPMDYPDSYENSRALFGASLDIARESGLQFEREAHGVPQINGESLYTDVVYFPSTKTSDKLLVLTSGVHGAEGYTGSALMSQFIRHALTPEVLQALSVVLVHNVNPYGVAQNRRVNANNIDLNRNFLQNPEDSPTKNLGYKKLSSFLNPTTPASYGIIAKSQFFATSILKVVQEGMKTLRQAVVGGQKLNPKGIFYRGEKPEPEVHLFAKVLKLYAKNASVVFHIDLHTGYGERGKLHFFSTNTLASRADGLREDVFKGFELDTGKKEDFYRVTGDITQFTVDLLKPKTVLPMTFEFGTKDSQTLLGSQYSLRSVVLENQGFHYGYASDEARTAILNDFSELFNPSSQTWRKEVFQQFNATMDTVIPRFIAL